MSGTSQETETETETEMLEREKKKAKNEESFLYFVGTGSSTGVPRIGCLIQDKLTCPVCKNALEVDSKNRRRNPSVMLRYKGQFNILIDCGKTFREATITLMQRHNEIKRIDAVILTHAHADAFLGLDDLREFCWEQLPSQLTPFSEGRVEATIPVFVKTEDFPTIQAAFPYLVDSGKATGSGYVARLEFRNFAGDKPFGVHGVQFLPFTLDHGINSTCSGFRFGNVAYLSDAAGLPEATWKILEERPIDILIIDSLVAEANGNAGLKSHFALPQSVAVVRRLKPKKTYLIGMSHTFDYNNPPSLLKRLKENEGLDIEMSYDGLKIPIEL